MQTLVAQPRNTASAERAGSFARLGMVEKSKMPNHVTAACTQSDWASAPSAWEAASSTPATLGTTRGSGDRPAAPQLTAASPARCPPAEAPQMAPRFTSMW